MTLGGSFVVFVLEAIVATLLLATITYCVIVNRKLEKLRADQENLKSIIRDLNQSTLQAEAAAGELRTTVEKASKELAIQINRAENSSSHLRNQNDKADGLLNRLSAMARLSKDKDDAPLFGNFSPRNGFPLEGAAAKEEPVSTIDQEIKTALWPQLRLSKLSQNGLPEPEEDQASAQPEASTEYRRSRFQWET